MPLSSLPFASPFSLLSYFDSLPGLQSYDMNNEMFTCILLSASQGPQFDAES